MLATTVSPQMSPKPIAATTNAIVAATTCLPPPITISNVPLTPIRVSTTTTNNTHTKNTQQEKTTTTTTETERLLNEIFFNSLENCNNNNNINNNNCNSSSNNNGNSNNNVDKVDHHNSQLQPQIVGNLSSTTTVNVSFKILFETDLLTTIFT